MFAEYSPSKILIDSHFIAIGLRLTHAERIEFDPTALTPEQRAVLVECKLDHDYKREIDVYQMPARTTGARQKYTNSGEAIYGTERASEFDELPTIADWIARAADALASREAHQAEFDRAAASHREQVRAEVQQIVDNATASVRERIAQRNPAGITHNAEIAQYRLDDARKAGAEIDLSNYRAAVAEYKSLLPVFSTEAAEREAASKAERETAKAAQRAERVAWANEHGSDQLKRNLALGHDCKRLYTIERAAIEFPGYVPDIEDTAEFKSITCASVAALDEREAVLAAHDGLDPDDVIIRWMTSEPLARKRGEHEAEYYESEFEPCECVAIDHPHLGRLVKSM